MSGLPLGASQVRGYQGQLDAFVKKPVYQSQQPRCVVKIDGNPYIPDGYSCTWNAHGATDQGTITIPIDGVSNLPALNGQTTSPYPDWTVSINRSDEAGNANQPVVAEVWAGEPTDPAAFGPTNLSGLTLRFRGVVDQYSVQLAENQTSFSLRSLAFPLTSTKITVPFPDEDTVTTVAFIAQQTKRYGLKMATPLLGQPPLRMIDVFGSEFIHTLSGRYIWDIMIQCAMMDDVDIWVDRMGVLHYEAASLITRPKIYYIWGENCKGIDATHSPQFSKNVRVQVHSWTARTRTVSGTRTTTDPTTGGVTTNSFTRIVTGTPIFGTTDSLTTSISSNGTVTTSYGQVSGGGASGSSGSESESGLEKYVFFPKNKTLAQCEVLANQWWRQISMHEYAVKISAPVTSGNLPLMDVTAQLVLSGHPMTFFNGYYWPREITETFDVKSGWLWEIDALSHELPSGV